MEIEHFLKAFVARWIMDLQQRNNETYENAAQSILFVKENPENADILQVLSIFTHKSIEEILDGIQTTAKTKVSQRKSFRKGYKYDEQ